MAQTDAIVLEIGASAALAAAIVVGLCVLVSAVLVAWSLLRLSRSITEAQGRHELTSAQHTGEITRAVAVLSARLDLHPLPSR